MMVLLIDGIWLLELPLKILEMSIDWTFCY